MIYLYTYTCTCIMSMFTYMYVCSAVCVYHQYIAVHAVYNYVYWLQYTRTCNNTCTHGPGTVHCAGVIARHPSFLPYIKRALTTDVVRNYFGHFLDENSTITRYKINVYM